MPSTHIYEYPSAPLNLMGWQGSPVIEHAQELMETVNTGSLTSIADQVGSTVFGIQLVNEFLN